MRARFLLVLCVFLFAVAASAQQSDRLEVFGGYSRTGYGVYQQYSGPWVSAPFNGWEASATANLRPHVGVEVDFAGGYSSTNHWSLRTYMVGPHFSTNAGRLGVYGHALFGGLHFDNGGLSSAATSFAFALGGGADLWFSRHIGARLIQFDYLRNNNQAAVLGFEPVSTAKNGPGNSYRIATGIVFRF